MSDPTIKRASAFINYTGSDGYRSEVSYSSTRAPAGKPEVALLDAFEDLSRLLHLFGYGAEAMKRAAEAAERVQTWRDQRDGKTLYARELAALSKAAPKGEESKNG